MKIETLDRSVEQVLSTGYYRIPRFQRPYSWTLENLEEFWTDTIVDSGGDYFIGAVIVFATASNRFDVVDGQQRFTTLTIMLAALRDCYDKNALPKLAQGLHAFVERPNVSNDPEFVLQTETSYPYLHEHIQKHGPPDSGTGDTGPEEEALQAARRFFGFKLDAIVRTVLARIFHRAAWGVGCGVTVSVRNAVRTRLMASSRVVVQGQARSRWRRRPLGVIAAATWSSR